MSEKKPGLPESFKIEVEAPVDLGDYLDVEFEKVGAIKKGELPPVSEPRRPEAASLASERPVADEVEEQVSSETAGRTKRKTEPPRKQINMRPETLQKADELLKLIRIQGPQRDAAASEMFDAIIATLHQSRGKLDLSRVTKRGRWGTPTAAAFVTSLGEAISEAIAQKENDI